MRYKGREENHESRRAAIVEKLTESGCLIPAKTKDVAITNSGGDALDSILAALSAFRFASLPEKEGIDPVYLTEGMIFY